MQTAVSADYLKLRIQELFTGQFEINKHKTDISFISLLQRVQEYKSQNQIKSLQPGKVVGLLVIVFFFLLLETDCKRLQQLACQQEVEGVAHPCKRPQIG